jgi:hypothetical protein
MEGKITEATAETVNLIEQARAAMNQRKFYEDQEDKLKMQIKAIIGDAEVLQYQEMTLATYKSAKPSQKFDSNKFQSDHPDLFSQYLIEVEGLRRLLIKEVSI